MRFFYQQSPTINANDNSTPELIDIHGENTVSWQNQGLIGTNAWGSGVVPVTIGISYVTAQMVNRENLFGVNLDQKMVITQNIQVYKLGLSGQYDELVASGGGVVEHHNSEYGGWNPSSSVIDCNQGKLTFDKESGFPVYFVKFSISVKYNNNGVAPVTEPQSAPKRKGCKKFFKAFRFRWKIIGPFFRRSF